MNNCSNKDKLNHNITGTIYSDTKCSLYLLQGVAVTAVRKHESVLEHFVTLAAPGAELDLLVLVTAHHHRAVSLLDSV